MRRAFALALLAALVFSAAAGVIPPTVGASDGLQASNSGPTGSAAPAVEDDAVAAPAAAGPSPSIAARQAAPTANWDARTTFHVQLYADRTADWEVVTRYRLETENDTEAFRQYGDEFERGDAAGAVSATTFERLANASSRVAGRQMAVQNVSREARVEGGTGVLALSFSWTNFLGTASESDLLVLRDALRLPGGGTWLSTLQSNQRLVIETPPGYAINSTSVPVVQRSGSIIVDGPRSLPADEPLTVRYQPTTKMAQVPWELVAGAAVALAVISGVAIRRRRSGSGSDAATGESADASADEVESPTGGGSGTTLDGGVTAEADEATSDGAAEPEEDLSLLSDEERVERLLERNSGRMRQTKIVEETGWSDAKVSQLLSAMADDDRVEKLRLGRENLISLPGTDIGGNGGAGADEDAS